MNNHHGLRSSLYPFVLLAVGLLSAPRTQADSAEFDSIPLFGGAATATAQQSGAWSDAAIWNHVPTSTDVVVIPAGLTVNLSSSVSVKHLRVYGTLQLQSNAALLATSVVGWPSSTIMTPASTSNVAITLRDTPLDLSTDLEQYGTGLISAGTVQLYGVQKESYLLVSNVTRGVDGLVNRVRLTVNGDASGWLPGDVICIPEFTQQPLTKDLRKNGVTHEQTERAIIQRVMGADVYVDPLIAGQSLNFPVKDAHVANLTRSIQIRSQNPAGTRGHVMFLDPGLADLRYVEFADLGRTSAMTPLNSAKKVNGVAVSPGTNQIGRYSLHLHRMHAHPVSVHGISVHDGRKWALALHDSHYGEVRDSVFARCDGAGFVTEEGNEVGNTIASNMALGIRSGYRDTNGFGGVSKISDTLTDIGLDGAGFWFRTAGNHVEHNVAAACFTGFNYNGYYLDTISWPDTTGTIHDDPLVPYQTSKDNEAYGVGIGLWLTWHLGTELAAYPETNFEHFTIRNAYGNGVELYHTAHVRLSGFVVHDDPIVSGASQGDNQYLGMLGRYNSGVYSGHDAYENGGLILDHVEITGFNVGAHLPMNTETETADPGTVQVLGGLFSNYLNLAIESPMTERQIAISNVVFVPTQVNFAQQLNGQPMARAGGAGNKSILPNSETDLWLRNTIQLEKHAAQAAFFTSSVVMDGKGVFFLDQIGSYIIPNTSGIDPFAINKTNDALVALGHAPLCNARVPVGAVQRARVIAYLDP